MAKISVVIPCYNHGGYLQDAIHSVLSQTFQNIEIIVVDDGSTDLETVSILDRIDYPCVKLLRTVNNGLSSARNTGIAASSGEYILPLDADDRIAPGYLEKGAEVLDHTPAIDVVYGRAEYFGARSGSWELGEFSSRKLLVENMVFCTSLFRRKCWQLAGGYDPAMRFGWEDWEFWLTLCEHQAVFYRLPEVVFYYRIHSSSMTSSMRLWQKALMMGHMVIKHRRLYLRTLMSGMGLRNV